jgi:hypothetical protein
MQQAQDPDPLHPFQVAQRIFGDVLGVELEHRVAIRIDGSRLLRRAETPLIR